MQNMWQVVYDQDGNKCHVGCSYQYWNDACWHRSVPMNTSGLTYLDVGCCNGLFVLRFAQSGGEATGIDCRDGLILNAKEVNNLGAPIEENIESFKILRDEFDIHYSGVVGGFDHKGDLHPLYDQTYDIVSCMNTIEYIDPLPCLDSLKAKTKSRLIVCTDITNEATYAMATDIRCVVSNIQEIIDHVGWKCTLWSMEPITETGFPGQGFFVFDNPESTLPPFDPSPPHYDMNLTETQKYRSR